MSTGSNRIPFGGMTRTETETLGVILATALMLERTGKAEHRYGIRMPVLRTAVSKELDKRGLYNIADLRQRFGRVMHSLARPHGQSIIAVNKDKNGKNLHYYRFWTPDGTLEPWWVEVSENCDVPII